MKASVKKLYEGMFLVDSSEAASDWEGVNQAVRDILAKADAEIVMLRKWDERRLAYEIQGKGKGTYLLCYFRAGGDRIREIERNVMLSERLMRALILSAEGRDERFIEHDIKGEKEAVEPQEEEKPVVEASQKEEAVAVSAESEELASGVEASEQPETENESQDDQKDT